MTPCGFQEQACDEVVAATPISGRRDDQQPATTLTSAPVRPALHPSSNDMYTNTLDNLPEVGCERNQGGMSLFALLDRAAERRGLVPPDGDTFAELLSPYPFGAWRQEEGLFAAQQQDGFRGSVAGLLEDAMNMLGDEEYEGIFVEGRTQFYDAHHFRLPHQ